MRKAETELESLAVMVDEAGDPQAIRLVGIVIDRACSLMLASERTLKRAELLRDQTAAKLEQVRRWWLEAEAELSSVRLENIDCLREALAERDSARQEGRQETRTLIIAWLRSQARAFPLDSDYADALCVAADLIAAHEDEPGDE